MPAAYDYLFLDLDSERGAPPGRAIAGFTEVVQAERAEIAAAGGEVLGLFTPQLGWVARQAALLVRWRDGEAKGREGSIRDLAKVKAIRAVQRAHLTPTLRPGAADAVKPGGIHVHRWFVVETPQVPEFLELSGQGWRDFEARFDTHIFGLFAAERSAQDRAARVSRLLLITRYGSHGVWEASRDPSTEAMAAFQKRQAMTRDTWAASTLFSAV